MRQARPVKLSVAMITYNHERYISQALESALAQRANFDYEIVVGEDCSTDGTRAILLDFHRRYPDRIVPLFHDRNLGMMRNFQETLAACRGTYLAMLEGDDYWTCQDKLQRQVDFLDQNPDYAICCHRVRILNETQTERPRIGPPIEFTADSYTVEDLLAANFIHTGTVMYRWGTLGRLPDWFLDLKLGDWPLHILVARTGKIRLMDEVMAVYRMHPGGLWTSKSPIDQLESQVNMFQMVDRYLNFQYTRAISRTVASYYFDMAAIERRMNGSRWDTMKRLAACLRAGKTRLPGRVIDWASLLGYGFLGIKRFRWWMH